MIKVKIKLQGFYIGEAIMTFEEITKAERAGFIIVKLETDKKIS